MLHVFMLTLSGTLLVCLWRAGRGLSYRHGLDCLVQTVRSEGPLALYKGGGTHFARLGPHIVLVFVFLEQFKKWS